VVGSEVLGWRDWGVQIRARGGRLFSLCGRGTGVALCGDELTGGGCARGGEVRDRANPVLVGVGDRLFARGADEGRSSMRGELVRGEQVLFSFVFSVWCGVGAQRPDALLAPDVRVLAGPPLLWLPQVCSGTEY